MNTILITGTAKTTITGQVEYDVNIWAAKEGEQIQLIRPLDKILTGYSELWEVATQSVIKYFDNFHKFDDGAYTAFLDHLIIIR